MEDKVAGATLTVRAIAGLHVVFLAWDFTNGLPASAGSDFCPDSRSSVRSSSAPAPSSNGYMLRGTKRFQTKDEGLEPGTPVPTDEHPIQSFQWGDYTVHPATRYRFRVIPVTDGHKLLRLPDDQAVTIEIETETEVGSVDGTGVRHDIYFNRGVAGSQAFVRRFKSTYIVNGKFTANQDDTTIEPMQWLSRGLFEGLQRFLAFATDSSFSLKAMLGRVPLPAGRAALQGGGRSGCPRRHPVRSAELPGGERGDHRNGEDETGLQAAGVAIGNPPQQVRRTAEGRTSEGCVDRLDQPVTGWDLRPLQRRACRVGRCHRRTVRRILECADRSRCEGGGASNRRAESPIRMRDTRRPASQRRGVDVIQSAGPCRQDQACGHARMDGSLIERAGEVACLTLPFNFDDTLKRAIAVQNDVLRMVVMDKKLSDDEEEAIRVDHDDADCGRIEAERGRPSLLQPGIPDRLQPQQLHPRQVPADRPARRGSDRGHRVGELLRPLTAEQRREHAGHPRRQAGGPHLLRRVPARSSITSTHGTCRRSSNVLGRGTPTRATSRRPPPRGSTDTATVTRRSAGNTLSRRFAPCSSGTERERVRRLLLLGHVGQSAGTARGFQAVDVPFAAMAVRGLFLLAHDDLVAVGPEVDRPVHRHDPVLRRLDLRCRGDLRASACPCHHLWRLARGLDPQGAGQLGREDQGPVPRHSSRGIRACPRADEDNPSLSPLETIETAGLTAARKASRKSLLP